MSREGIQPGAAHRRFEALPDEAREAGSFDPELRALVRAHMSGVLSRAELFEKLFARLWKIFPKEQEPSHDAS